MKRPIQLLDLVSKEKLEKILQVFTEVTGVASIIAGVDGQPITRPHNFTFFCLNYCRSTDQGRAKCQESDSIGGRESARLKKPYIHNCLNSGLIDCATPVIVEGYHLATILAGQVLEEPIALHVAVEKAQAIGITDTEGYLRALADVPLMSRERLLTIANLMSEITHTISELALQKFLLHKHSQHYLSRLINSVSDCIISTNAVSSITMVNQAGAAMFGREAEQLIGQPLLTLLADEDSRSVYQKNLDSNLGCNWRAELKAVKTDGQAFPVQVSFSSINDGNDQNIGYVGVIRDISEEKRLERMKEDLIGMITHDMRNPVLSVQKALQLLVNGTLGPLTENQRSVMELALVTSHQLFGMVSDILDIYRNENGQFMLYRTPVMMNEVVMDSIRQVDFFAKEKNLSIRFISSSPISQIIGDQKRLRRTCVNLLDNAIKYSPERSEIVVQTLLLNGKERQADRLRKQVTSLPPLPSGERYILFTISDQGIGIVKKYHQRIFDKYFTVESEQENRREGVGLGLAFCKQVIEAHNGAIWVESPLGEFAPDRHRGCRFHFVLPVD
ncbi:MAG: PocR ligand-binding domain-containing protein [Desulforhabdus sp.]|jgi:PAS domain S-box-containing protein|nr:PocR ligand-binding domain-containing protein [Desulforhabdus sp.]